MTGNQKPLGRHIHCLNNAIKRELDRSAPVSGELREIITGGNGRILCYLERNRDRDIFIRDVEKEFGITRSTASRTLSLMEKKGLVKTEGVKDDGRLKKVMLTEKSACLTRALHDNADALEERLVRGFTPEEIDAFRGYLERALQNLPGCDPDKEKGETT